MSTARQDKMQLVAWTKKEASYGSGIADGESGSFAPLFKGEAHLPQGKFNDAPDVIGRGHEWPGGIRETDCWDARVSRSMYLNSRLAGWLMAFGFGSVSSSASGDGNRHIAKPLATATDTQLPSTAFIECQSDEGTKRKFYGMVMESWSVSGTMGPNWVECSYEMIGSGKTASSSVTVPTPVEVSPFHMTDMSVATIGASSARNVLSRVRSFSYQGGNLLLADRGYKGGSPLVNGAAVRQGLEFGNRRDAHQLELVLDALRGSTPEVDDWEAGTAQSVVLTFPGALIVPVTGTTHYEWTLRFPNCYIASCEPVWDGQVKTYKLVFKPHYNTGTSTPVQAETVDNQSSYLSAAV